MPVRAPFRKIENDKAPIGREVLSNSQSYSVSANALLVSLRPLHWAKNFLIFAPMLAAHQWANGIEWLRTITGFVIFCMLASGTYLFNDLVDLENDKFHRLKQHRPLANGKLQKRVAIIAQILLLAGALVSAFCLETRFGWVSLAYVLITFSYSLWLKSILIVDVIVLGLLYIIRIIAGHAVNQIHESFWMLSFFGFLFLSLAFLKRFVELEQSIQPGIVGRSYLSADKPVILASGIASGLLSVSVFAFYINSPEVLKLYREPRWLWLVLPVYTVWILRAWINAGRGLLHDDPVVYSLKEPLSYIVVFTVLVTILLAIQ